jgi:hypothetical protein
LQHLHRAVGQVVDAVKGVAPVNEELIRSAKVRFDFQRNQFAATFRGSLEYGKTQNFAMEMEGNVASEFFGIILQNLKKNKKTLFSLRWNQIYNNVFVIHDPLIPFWMK